MSNDFKNSWLYRKGEFPICYVNTSYDVGAPKATFPGKDGPTIQTPKVRLTFPSLFPNKVKATSNPPTDDNHLAALDEALSGNRLGEPYVPKASELAKSDKDRWNVCAVAGEDLKAGDVVNVSDDGTLKKATASDEETRERAEEALKKADMKYTTVLKIEGDDKIREAIQAAQDDLAKKITPLLPFTGHSLDRVDPALLKFLNRLGQFNGIGEVIGVMQYERGKLRVEYRKNWGGKLTVDFEIPYPLQIPLMGY